MSPPNLYLLYDVKCAICCLFRTWVERLDSGHRVRSLALDDPELPRRFPNVDLVHARAHLTVCSRSGRCYHSEEALRQIVSFLPGLRRLGWIYRLPGVAPVAGGVYRAVNRNRLRLCGRCGEKWTSLRRRGWR